MKQDSKRPKAKNCPCKGKRSAKWHRDRGLIACDVSTKKHSARELVLRAARKKGIKATKPEPPIDCVCGGKENASWHRHRKLQLCKYAREHRQAQDRESTRLRKEFGTSKKWIPGTDIVIPEYDPL